SLGASKRGGILGNRVLRFLPEAARLRPALPTAALGPKRSIGRRLLAIGGKIQLNPCFFPETGRFSRKTGRRLSTNGQSLGGILPQPVQLSVSVIPRTGVARL